MMRILGLMLVMLAVAGCDLIVPPWKISSLKETARRPVTCLTGPDCEQKWARALAWLQRNSQLPITRQSSSLLETDKSINLNPHPGFVIVKMPAAAASGISTIIFQASCDDSFGCSPPLLELKASFVNAVMGMPPAE